MIEIIQDNLELIALVVAGLAGVATSAIAAKYGAKRAAIVSGAARGAFMVLAKLSKYTKNEYDDFLDDLYANMYPETGKLSAKERLRVEAKAVAMLADDRFPTPVDGVADIIKERLGGKEK